MLLDKDRDKNIDLIGKKVSIFCRTHIAVGHRIQGESPGPLQLKYAVEPHYDVIMPCCTHTVLMPLYNMIRFFLHYHETLKKQEF